MSTSDPPVASFGRLAAAALAHPDWPADTRPKQRSLATLFSKLDREQDLEWLADRIPVQRILAELMNRPVADLRQALPVRRSTPSERLVRLDDLRYGRELDLTKEPLCPGIPSRVLQPATWGRLAWRAPSGAGRSLAGAWLQARGLATHRVLEGPPDRSAPLPDRGPLFLEITGWDGPQSAAERWRTWAARLSAEPRPVCVALAHPPTEPPWEVIDSPPLDDVLPELVGWVAERLPADGLFEPERALTWMRRVALPSEAVVTLGDALGLLGMLDEVRPRTLHGRSLDEIAESFVRQRLAESSEEATVSSWLNRNAAAALLGTIAQLVTESDQPWNRPRTFDEWLALVPQEYREGIDVEWMRAALTRDSGQRLRGADLAAAARKLPPGGYQLLRALEHARILVRDGERLRLRPHWLGSTLQARAVHELVSTSAFAWGAALLRPAHAPRVIRALFQRARRGDFAPAYAALELADPEEPASAAAVEAATTVIGLTAACGGNIPADLIADLVSEQDRLALILPDAPPRPRITHRELDEPEPLLHPGAWLLGVYALAELAPPRRSLLDPFRSARPEREARTLRRHVYPELLRLLQESTASPIRDRSSVRYDALEVHHGTSSSRHPWPLTIYLLVDSLRHAVGAAAETPLPLELPSAVADALADDRLSPDLLQRLDELPHALPALVALCATRELDWPRFCRRLWHAVDPRGALPRHFDPPSKLVVELWRGAPTDWIRRRVAAQLPLPWEHLLPHQYGALLQSGAPLSAEVARFAPLDSLLELVSRKGVDALDEAARGELWRRAPRRVFPLLHLALDRRDLPEARRLLESLPDELTPESLEALSTRVDVTALPLDELHPLRSWLAHRISRRVPGWAEAYRLLHRIEVALYPLRHQLF